MIALPASTWSRRLLSVALVIVGVGGLAASARAEGASAYLWAIRQGCQTNPLLEAATLSRVRGVGRQIILLNVPSTPEALSCSGKSCADLIRRAAGCGQLRGPLVGAELDEFQGPGGIVTRIRAWRDELTDDTGRSVLHEYLTCPAERCGHRELQEAVAKAINQLLDGVSVSAAQNAPSVNVGFPAAECLRSEENPLAGPLPGYCGPPLASACSTEELIPPEPSGRSMEAVAPSRKEPPRAVPQRWEWLPIASTLVGLAASVGIGIANDYYVTPNDVGHVLTPALWTGVGLTVALAATSVAVVGDRYRREMRSFKEYKEYKEKEAPNPTSCMLLVDGGR